MAETNQPPDEFFNQFLDDYFAECEEHLTVVRRGLLNIEGFVDRPITNIAQLDELFRSFHTMKGISGMVGLAPAEQLAHQMEDYLRVLRQGEINLTKNGFDALIDGTKCLEQVIEAHKNHDPFPPIDKTIETLARATESEPGNSQRADEAKTESQTSWRFLFVPTQARADAGINVNLVRTRLHSIGEIASTTPIVQENEVVFEFIVATEATEDELQSLQELGLTFEKVRNESPETRQINIQAPGSTQTPATSVRVDLVRLDQLMLLVGELVVTRARLEQGLNSIRKTTSPAEWRKLQEVSVAFGKQLRDLRNDVMRVRMVPIAEVFERMRFVVRDIARETGKNIRLDLSGEGTQIDKFLVERLMDPLLHLVRNSISHGIEPEAERIANGKSREGHIFLRARTSGELVIVEAGDDGRGIDVQGVAARADGVTLVDAEGHVDFDKLLNTIATPGFSTRERADRASGRGVGMDVVSSAIKDLAGHLSLQTEAGKGTTFTISLPLTLAITDALIASAGNHTFAIHRSSVQEVIQIEPASIKVLENNEIILHRDEVLPLVRLSRVFNLEDRAGELLYAFVIGQGNRATGLVVDKVIGLREVVVRTLTDPLTDVQGVAGATELGDGKAILILDVGEILSAARETSTASGIHR